MSIAKFNKWQSVDGVTRNAVLQVVSSGEIKTATSNSTTGYIDATNMSLAITPTSATSKILVCFSVGYRIGSSTSSSYIAFRLLRDSEVILTPYVDNGTGQYTFGISSTGSTATLLRSSALFETLDSPSTTNEIVYKLQFRLYIVASGAIAFVNEGCSSSITLMEIAQ